MIKYSNKIHIRKLLKKGIIRIGTLHEYRNSDYCEGIHDNTEGRKEVTITIPNRVFDLSLSDPTTQSIKNNFFDGKLQGEGKISFTGDGPMFIKRIDHPNCFIFCTSSQRVDLVPKTFGYDAGVKIINPEKFIGIISKVLSAKYGAKLVYFGKVNYMPKTEEWNFLDFGDNPALYKDESFSYQSEIRALWTLPSNKPIAPVILEIPELTKYVHQIRLE